MAHILELNAQPRSVSGKHVRKLRRDGIIPANIYGNGESRAIQAPLKQLDELLTRGGRTGVVTISVDGRTQTALLKGMQRDPRSGRLTHVDFQAVSMNQRVTAAVPLRFVGEAPAEKLGAMIIHASTTVQVDALARDLPEGIEVDLGQLTAMDTAIKVSDLAVPEGLTVLDPGDGIVARAETPRSMVGEGAEETSEPATAGTAAVAPGESSSPSAPSAAG